MPFSSVRRKSFSVSLMICRFFEAYMLRTHRLACPWGSIISGQRRPIVVSSPFSQLKSSAGSPSICQPRNTTGTARAFRRVNSLQGMPSSLQTASHLLTIFIRNWEVKGPK